MGINEDFSGLKEFNNLDVPAYTARHPDLFAYVREQMAGPGKQFLLIGDTSHKDGDLEKFLHGPALAALFSHAAVPHVAWETPREMIPQARLDAFRDKCSQYRQGLLTAAGLNDARIAFFTGGLESGRYYWDKSILGFMEAGLRTTPADSIQWRDGTPCDAERVFLGDREVASYIEAQAHGDKTAFVYGAAHLCYDGSLGTRLSREKCVHIDIYASRAAYERVKNYHDTHVDVTPDKVYLVEERALEEPDRAAYFSASDRLDDPRQSEKDDIARNYGPEAEPFANATAMMNRVRILPQTNRRWFDYVPG
jgi:hypothetical protein